MTEPGVIYREAAQVCEECGTTAETRPYGRDGREVCFNCATVTPEARAEAKRRMGEYLGDGVK